MTLVKKVSAGVATGALVLGFASLSVPSAFAVGEDSTSSTVGMSEVSSEATYDLIFDPENPGKATMNAHKAKFVERG